MVYSAHKASEGLLERLTPEDMLSSSVASISLPLVHLLSISTKLETKAQPGADGTFHPAGMALVPSASPQQDLAFQ